MVASAYYFIFPFPHLCIYYSLHTYTLVHFTSPGAFAPRSTAIKCEYLFQCSSAPRTYSIICIGSESCLRSIVGLPGSCAYYLTFRYIGKDSKGRTTAIVSRFIRMSTLVEKAENWLSWCGESRSTLRRFQIDRDFFRIMRGIGFYPIRCL